MFRRILSNKDIQSTLKEKYPKIKSSKPKRVILEKFFSKMTFFGFAEFIMGYYYVHWFLNIIIVIGSFEALIERSQQPLIILA